MKRVTNFSSFDTGSRSEVRGTIYTTTLSRTNLYFYLKLQAGKPQIIIALRVKLKHTSSAPAVR
jgi:hypothetical protein